MKAKTLNKPNLAQDSTQTVLNPRKSPAKAGSISFGFVLLFLLILISLSPQRVSAQEVSMEKNEDIHIAYRYDSNGNCIGRWVTMLLDFPTPKAQMVNNSSAATSADNDYELSENWQIYPIPAKDRLSISCSTPIDLKGVIVRIHSSDGRLVRMDEYSAIETWPLNAEVSDLSIGTYLLSLELQYSDGQVRKRVFRFIKD